MTQDINELAQDSWPVTQDIYSALRFCLVPRGSIICSSRDNESGYIESKHEHSSIWRGVAGVLLGSFG